MEKCINCYYYDDSDSYQGTGYCMMVGDYTKDDDSCEDYQDIENSNVD